MKRAQAVLVTWAIFLMLGSVSAQAQVITKASLITATPPISTPVPGKADPHNKSAWICTSAGGLCVDPYPEYIGAPCSCCSVYGCFPGTITGLSSVEHPDNVAQSP
jgi:hypothetical protein